MNDVDRAREYSRLKERLGLLGTALGLLGGVLFVFSGLGKFLARRLLPRRGSSPGSRAAYSGVLGVASWLAGLPLAYFSGYVVEHRYGLSRQSRAGWLSDQLKGQALGLAIGLPLIEGLYRLIRRFPRWWWLAISLLAVPLTTAMAHLFPVLIAPRFNTFTPIEDEELAERLRVLAAHSGIEVAEVLAMDMSRRTSKANAYFAGLGSTKRIVLSDTLLEQFSHDEIEAVVAHEIAHQANRDIWRFIALSGIFTLATGALANRFVRRFLERSGRRLLGTRELADIRSLPALGMAFSVAGLLLTPLQLGYSRDVERRADAYALALTRNPDAFSSAMLKLATTNLADPTPSRARVWLLYSHPPIVERVARADAVRPLDLAHREREAAE